MNILISSTHHIIVNSRSTLSCYMLINVNEYVHMDLPRFRLSHQQRNKLNQHSAPTRVANIYSKLYQILLDLGRDWGLDFQNM